MLVEKLWKCIGSVEYQVSEKHILQNAYNIVSESVALRSVPITRAKEEHACDHDLIHNLSLSLAKPNRFANNFMGYDSRKTSNVKHSTFVPLILSA